MNPAISSLNSDQQNRFSSIMNTPTPTQNNTQSPNQSQGQNPQPGDLSSHTQLGSSPSQSISGQSQNQNGQGQQTQQSTYQVPTVGMPTSPTFGSPATSNATTQKKPTVKVNAGGSKLLPVLYVVGGIIFLGVYTIIWAVVFGLSIPFLPF